MNPQWFKPIREHSKESDVSTTHDTLFNEYSKKNCKNLWHKSFSLSHFNYLLN